MSDEFVALVDRLNTHHAAEVSDLTNRADSAAQQRATSNGILPAGTRVLDTVSGIEGNVEGGRYASVQKTTLIAVRVASGGVLLRSRDQLLVRPTLPEA